MSSWVLVRIRIVPRKSVFAGAGRFDRVGGVDDQVEKNLTEFADVAAHERKICEVGLDVGEVFVFVARDGEHRLDRVVDVRGVVFVGPRVPELAHRGDDLADSLNTGSGPVDRGG